MRRDRPHHGLDLSTLDCAVLIPKPIVEMIPRATKHGGWPRVGLSGIGFLKAKIAWKECSLEPLGLKQHARRMNGGDAKRVCAKLYEPRWLLAERDQIQRMPIDGP